LDYQVVQARTNNHGAHFTKVCDSRNRRVKGDYTTNLSGVEAAMSVGYFIERLWPD